MVYSMQRKHFYVCLACNKLLKDAEKIDTST